MVTPAGEWARDKNYEILSFVRHDGSGYLAIKNNNGVEPGTDDLIWMLVCERGYTPKLTVDDEGNLYSDGELVSTIFAYMKAGADIVVQNEADRVAAEAKRVSAENARAEAEGERREAERRRASAEAKRQNNEETRQREEDRRRSAETGRELAETNRNDAESSRRAEEAQRQSAETERINNENIRIRQEAERVEAMTSYGSRLTYPEIDDLLNL